MDHDRERREYYEKKYGNRERCFFVTGMKMNRALRNLDSCINEVQDVGPLQPTNREIQQVLEDLRQVRRRLSVEYSRLVDENMTESQNSK